MENEEVEFYKVIGPDFKLTINSNDDSFCVNVNKTYMCQQSDFFFKLFEQNKSVTEITLPFDKQIASTCLQLFTFISSARNSYFSRRISQYEYNLDKKLMEFFKSKFIEKIHCLTYLQTDIEIVASILYNYNPSEDFDINEFVKIDAVPLEYRWGYWSLYGNSDVMPDKPIQQDRRFIPVSLKMDSYLDYTIIFYDKCKFNTTLFDDVKLDTYMTVDYTYGDEIGVWLRFYQNDDDESTLF